MDAVKLTPAEQQSEVEKAARRFDSACRDWDLADSAWQYAWREAGGTYRDMDSEVHKARSRAGYRKRTAAYRLMIEEFMANTRPDRPCNPDNPDCPQAPGCKCSHYYGRPN